MPLAGGKRLVGCKNECGESEGKGSDKIVRRAKGWYGYRRTWRIFRR